MILQHKITLRLLPTRMNGMKTKLSLGNRSCFGLHPCAPRNLFAASRCSIILAAYFPTTFHCPLVVPPTTLLQMTFLGSSLATLTPHLSSTSIISSQCRNTLDIQVIGASRPPRLPCAPRTSGLSPPSPSFPCRFPSHLPRFSTLSVLSFWPHLYSPSTSRAA